MSNYKNAAAQSYKKIKNFNLKIYYLCFFFKENKRTGSERPDIAQLVEHFDQHPTSNSSYIQNTSVNSAGFIQISSPTPNLIINEIDFNLIINGNTSLSSTTGSSTGSNNIGGYSAQITAVTSNQTLNTAQSQMSQQINKTSSDLIDSRGGVDRGTGTPVFFNSYNLMIGGQLQMDSILN